MIVVAAVLAISPSEAVHDDVKSNSIGSSDAAVRSRRLRRSNATSLSPREISEVVDLHNRLRAQEGSDNMELMYWNDTLAKMAATWANRCVFEHPYRYADKYPEYFNTGQNIHYVPGTARLNLTAIIQDWYDEKGNYLYDEVECMNGKECGHYLQIVSATTKQVGCAYHTCDQLSRPAQFLVCNYESLRFRSPYTKGAACSKCAGGAGWCKNRLCDTSCSNRSADCPWKSCAIHCYNCASVDNDTCRCECADGWRGDYCELPCEDTQKYCKAYPGWSPEMCKTMDYVFNACPAMCKTCTVDPNAEAGKCPPVYGPGAYFSENTSFIGAQRATFMSAVISMTLSCINTAP